MKFLYIGKDGTGQSVRGEVSAKTQNEAIELLQAKGIVLTKIALESADQDVMHALNKYWEGVKTKEIVIFFRQISALISAKVPLLTSLRTIERQIDNPYFGSIIGQIASDVEDGTALSEAIQKHKAFDSFVVNMIRAGEVSGRLGESIEQVADNLEANYELSAKIKGAMMYPSVILLVTVSVGIFVMSYILPKITSIISDLASGSTLPWYTVVVIGISDFMGAYWWAVVFILIGAFVGGWYYMHTEAGQDEWDSVHIKFPVVGLLAKNVYIARFSENLSVLIRGGIPMVQSLIIVSDVVGNRHYKKIILEGAESVKKGGLLSDVMGKHPDVPPMVSQMIAIGEETGHLSETLRHVATFYQKETDRMTKNLTSLIEPILIVVLGGGVGLLVLAVLVPIFSLSNIG